jgi:putative nucleotidyltransferase with HDIG domain
VLFEEMSQSNISLVQSYDNTLEGWAMALEYRDLETEGHSRRVTDLTLRLAKQMGMREADLPHVRRGALLHDVGKMGIPDKILLKPGPLSEEEWVVMRNHPEYAHQMLRHIDFLRPALEIPYCHHEKWDGSGYPRGLKGDEIPLAARIFAVVDVWDALLSDRPYREAWPVEKAFEYVKEQSGKHFDPAVVEAFLSLQPQSFAPGGTNRGC